MHQCLGIKEIQSIIFEFLYSGYNVDYRELSTLANLAVTCRELSDTALDVLWQVQGSLFPLIKVMPPDLWTIHEGSEVLDITDDESDSAVDVISFVRELEESDWSDRFFYYGRKIRELGYESGPVFERVDLEAMMALSAYRPTHDPLPNIQSLRIYLDDARAVESVPFMQFLLGPKITDVFLVVGGSECGGAPPIGAISRLCPDIHTLTVDAIHGDSSDDIPAIHRFVCRLKHLRSVAFYQTIPSREAILHLSRLDSLHTWVDLQIHPQSQVDFQLFTTNDGQFASLRTFGLAVRTWDLAARVMDSMHCPFESLAVHQIFHEGPLTAFPDLTRTLMRNPYLESSLSSLELDGTFGADLEASEALQVLFSLRALQFVKLQIKASVNRLDNRWLAKAAHSWPEIRTLVVLVKTEEGSLITLEGFIPLIQHCVFLHELCIAAIWKPFDIRLLDGKCNRQILRLRYIQCGIESPGEVAICLRAMFPLFERIEWGEWGWYGPDTLTREPPLDLPDTESAVGSTADTESAGEKPTKGIVDSPSHVKLFLELRKLLKAGSGDEPMTN